MAKKKNRKSSNNKLDQDILRVSYSLLAIVIALLGLLELGGIGYILNIFVTYLVGNMYGIVYLLIILGSLMIIFNKNINIAYERLLGIFILLVCFTLICSIPTDKSLVGMDVFLNYLENTTKILNQIIEPYGAGLIGSFLYAILSLLVGDYGVYIVLVALFLIGILFTFSLKAVKSFFGLFKKLFAFILKLFIVEEDEDIKAETKENFELPLVNKEIEVKKESKAVFFDESDFVLDQEENEEELFVDLEKDKEESKKYSNKIALPKISLLDDYVKNKQSNNNINAANQNGKRVVEILAQFGINVTLTNINIGPTVTKFEIKPETGVRVNKIASLQDDLKMALAAKDIRIEAPVPGKSVVGIEIPNLENSVVKMKEMMSEIPLSKANEKLLFTLGKDISGLPVFGELNKMPHLLVAGATGSGKSVCINSMIISLLLRATPDEVKLLLIDPKRVEFAPYTKIPHLLGPVISDPKEASAALKIIVNIMEARFDMFSRHGVKNMEMYNKLAEDSQKNESGQRLDKIPYIVVIIDELADLMTVASKEVEASIQRITQMARASGIHLVVATQRPSVDVITGVVKANIPSRIAFAVSSSIDSRTILDSGGAERLLGKGDMLYIPMGENAATRIQGVFISEEEINKVTDYWISQCEPNFDLQFTNLKGVNGQVLGGDFAKGEDPLYDDVLKYIAQTKKASISLIQRRFSLGYNRAARLIEQMEEQGLIGPANGSKPREVYINAKGEKNSDSNN